LLNNLAILSVFHEYLKSKMGLRATNTEFFRITNRYIDNHAT
jgi:hypothetical protein